LDEREGGSAWSRVTGQAVPRKATRLYGAAVVVGLEGAKNLETSGCKLCGVSLWRGTFWRGLQEPA